MKHSLFLAAVLAPVVVFSGAEAATITNVDTTPYTLSIRSQDTQGQVTVMPSEKVSIDELCPEKCIITMQNGDEYDVVKDDDLQLEGGGIFFEPSTQGSGPSEQPSEQPSGQPSQQ
jgi:hypothetical protein